MGLVQTRKRGHESSIYETNAITTQMSWDVIIQREEHITPVPIVTGESTQLSRQKTGVRVLLSGIHLRVPHSED